MSAPHPRFIVREGSGYAADKKPLVEVMVVDTDYCWRVVWSSATTITSRYSNGQRARANRWPLPLQRDFARALANHLNAGGEWPLPLRAKFTTHPKRERMHDAIARFIATAPAPAA